MISWPAKFHRLPAAVSRSGRAILRGCMPVFFALASGGCDGSSPASPTPSEQNLPIPSGPTLPVDLAVVTTTLDFGDPALSGRLQITPSAEAPDLHYAIDLDADGSTDEMGPVGLGVTLAYLYETSGPHEMGIAVREGNAWFRADRTVVVNDPGAIRVSDSVWYSEGLAGDFSGIAFDDARNVVYLATDGLERRDILALRSTDLEVLWRLSLNASANDPFNGDATALALSTDGRILYVDTGDSIEAVSVTGEPGSLGVIGPGDAGGSLVSGDDGVLYSGGSNGIARIDPGTGRVLARRSVPFGGSFSLSPEEDRIAFLESPHLCRLALMDARVLESLWTVDNLVPEQCLLVAFSPGNDALYVLAGRDGWLLVVVDVETGAVLRRMKLAEEDRRTRSPRVSSGSATVDGRYVAFSTERGAFLIDTTTHLPAYALRAITDDRAIGCCNVISSSTGFYTTGWNLLTRLSLVP